MESSSPPPLPSSWPPPPAAEEEKSLDLWYVGAIINVVGSISVNLGMNLMKLGHSLRSKLDMPEKEKPPIRKFKSWLIGVIVFSTGNVLNFVSFAFAAQSLLSALGSLQLVCNIVFAYFVNHERITWLIILSTLCIIGGCVVLVVFGNQGSETFTVDQLMQFYTRPAYVIYLVMMGVFMFGFYIIYLHAKKVTRKRGRSGVWYGLLLVSYSVFSALLGSQSVMFGKSLSVILRTVITGPGSIRRTQFSNWYTYIVLPIFIFTALFWVTRLNKGLRMYPVMVIVPLMQIAWTLFSIVSGMLYFQEYKGFNTLKFIMFPVGVLIVFFGVLLLTIGHEDEGQGAAGGQKDGMTVHENSTFSGPPEGEAGPPEFPPHPPKLSLGQSLRFTSTWAPASVVMSPGSRSLMPTDSLRRDRRNTEPPADLNASALTQRSNRTEEGEHAAAASTPDRNSTLNKTTHSNTSRASETPSMMGTMRKSLRSFRMMAGELAADTKTGFKLALGLGDEGLTGVGLGVFPALPAAGRRNSRSAGPHEMASSLPRSKFQTYKVDADLAPIREVSGLPTTKGPSPESDESLTNGSPQQGGRHIPSGGQASPFQPARLPPKDHYAALQDMLPGPSYKPPQEQANGSHQDPKPLTSAHAPNGLQYGMPEASLPLPGFGPRPGRAPSAGRATATPSPSGMPDTPASPQRQGGHGGGPADASAAAGPSGRQLLQTSSFGVQLPEGAPLSTANSIVLHESRPGTPPELMLGGAGPSGVQSGPRTPLPWLQQGPSPHQHPQHQMYLHQQYQQQPQYAAPFLQGGPLQRSQVLHVPGARLPRPHLLVPGMGPQLTQPAVNGAVLPYVQHSMSYAQLLSGHGGVDGLAYMQPNAGTGPQGGYVAVGGAPTAVLLQSRHHAPSGLSVSRSWAGLGNSGGGLGESRHSPLRGSYLAQARPLRPWQQY